MQFVRNLSYVMYLKVLLESMTNPYSCLVGDAIVQKVVESQLPNSRWGHGGCKT